MQCQSELLWQLIFIDRMEPSPENPQNQDVVRPEDMAWARCGWDCVWWYGRRGHSRQVEQVFGRDQRVYTTSPKSRFRDSESSACRSRERDSGVALAARGTRWSRVRATTRSIASWEQPSKPGSSVISEAAHLSRPPSAHPPSDCPDPFHPLRIQPHGCQGDKEAFRA